MAESHKEEVRGQSLQSQFPAAAQPEIMRAAEKDDYYVTHVCEACHDAFRHIFGTRLAVAYQNETQLAGHVLYYLLTTGSGLQTLGEEYCDISQAGSSGVPVVTANRILLVFFQTVLPYVAERLSAKAAARGVLLASQNGAESQTRITSSDSVMLNEARVSRQGSIAVDGALQTNDIARFPRISAITNHLRRIWLSSLQQWPMVLPSVREGLLLVVRANLMLFYFEGMFYHLSKRAAGVRYIFTGKPLHQRPRYHMLGMFLLIQLCIVAGDWLQRSVIPALMTSMHSRALNPTLSSCHGSPMVLDEDGKQVPTTKQHSGPAPTTKSTLEGSSTSKCPLCLSPRQHPTATPCGHVFCWICIAEWCNEKPECPLCRALVSHSDLACIFHADF